jgi:pSer/pThr/pTyr-binding forkhead associated (FHA) protein
VPELELLTGPRAGQRRSVWSELIVGRADADLELADADVSRHHAILRVLQSGSPEVEDLASTDGRSPCG